MAGFLIKAEGARKEEKVVRRLEYGARVEGDEEVQGGRDGVVEEEARAGIGAGAGVVGLGKTEELAKEEDGLSSINGPAVTKKFNSEGGISTVAGEGKHRFGSGG